MLELRAQLQPCEQSGLVNASGRKRRTELLPPGCTRAHSSARVSATLCTSLPFCWSCAERSPQRHHLCPAPQSKLSAEGREAAQNSHFFSWGMRKQHLQVLKSSSLGFPSTAVC